MCLEMVSEAEIDLLANSTFGVTTEHIGNLEMMINSDKAAQKGEGIGTINFISGRGKWANGGGGGNLHNGGGAGGGNAGKGGDGGFGCELCYGYKEIARGLGANDLNYSNTENRLFLGGGGGGGHRNGFSGSNGADGGGIVIIRANEIVGNNRTIKANGANSNPSIDDGAGGGGAGGTVVLDVNIFTGNLTINVKGGNGGGIISGNDGPGGGGSGGCIWSKSTLPSNIVTQINGGNAGARLNNNTNFGAKNGDNGKILNGLQIIEGISKYELPKLDFSLINPNCSGDGTGSIVFQNTNYKYAFNTNPFSTQKSYTNLKGGNYTFTILYDTINLCKYDTIISILDTNKILKSTLSVSQNAICDQLGAIEINTSGGLPPYSNELNNNGYLPTAVYKNLVAGVYKISTKDSKGCNSIDSITILDNSYKIDLSIEKLVDKSCIDTGSVLFKIQNTAVKNNIYLNNFPANKFNYLIPGNYFSYVIDSFGCKSDTLKFSIKDNFKNYNFSKNASICEGDTLNFDGNKLTQTGSYIFNYKTKENCDSSITLKLTINPKSSYSLKKEICKGDFVKIGNKTIIIQAFTEIL
ncbi:MAG: hypothetical protein IPL95_02955 [Saprospiraceae bacterium]|nr:hypothetical protein [Saprospiraceae bacterium]